MFVMLHYVILCYVVVSETYPTNLYYPPMEETQFFNEQFIHFWGELGDLGEDQEVTIRRSGYYSILVRPDLRVVNYNTNYGCVMVRVLLQYSLYKVN